MNIECNTDIRTNVKSDNINDNVIKEDIILIAPFINDLTDEEKSGN